MIAAHILPADALFDECIEAARERNMHLIGDGKRIVISPIIPPGWFKIGVKVIDRQRALLTKEA